MERRKASAPEARTSGDIRSCGARPAPWARKDDRFRRSAPLLFGGIGGFKVKKGLKSPGGGRGGGPARSIQGSFVTGAIATTRAAAAPAPARITNAIGGAYKSCRRDEQSRVRTKAESWTWLLGEGNSTGSEGRMRY